MSATIDWGAKARSVLGQRGIVVGEKAPISSWDAPMVSPDRTPLIDRLLAAAMRRCDEFGDGPAARADMRADVLSTPPHLQQDLLDYLTQVTS